MACKRVAFGLCLFSLLFAGLGGGASARTTPRRSRALLQALDVKQDNLGGDLSDSIASGVNQGKDRNSYVRDLVHGAYYGRGNQQQYSVCVINLKLKFSFDLENSVQYYAEAPYKGDKYGIWAFSKGTFINYGEGGDGNRQFAGKYREYKKNGGDAVSFGE